MSGADYTFRANRDRGRHGWLRLTPAYSVHLVEELVHSLTDHDRVLDPFCGTGTTALVCADRGIPCETVDINPFLVWFTRAKVRRYSDRDLSEAVEAARAPIGDAASWRPPMRFMERWWGPETILALSSIRELCRRPGVSEASRDLLRIGFCQTIMEHSKANFRHQSVSLNYDISQKIPNQHTTQITTADHFSATVEYVVNQARTHRPQSAPEVHIGNSRELSGLVGVDRPNELRFTSVVTSPPYANRMSYIRELRPYMYWLGFLESGQQAGEMDWAAIGGTWGRATSNLARWSAESRLNVDPRIAVAVAAIEERNSILGRYIRKYICDTADHLSSMRPLLAAGARITYIVGNSRFYEFMLDTEQIFAGLFHAVGLTDIEITKLRKRTSKRELFEFAVTGRVPSETRIGA